MRHSLPVVLLLALTIAAAAQEEESPRDLRDELFLAIELNDPAAVGRVLRDGGAIESDFGNPSPLKTAATLNNETIVELLLRTGADPARTVDNPLLAAVGNDNLRMVRLLLAAGAPVPGPEATEEELFEAALRGDNALEVARELMEHGAAADTGLRLAIDRGNADAAELFLQNGADVTLLGPDANPFSITDDPARARTWMTLALGTGDRKETLAYLLGAAIDVGKKELVDLAVESGAVVSYEELKRAAESDQEAMTRDLLQHVDDSLGSLLYQAEVEEAERLSEILRRVRRETLIERFLPVGLAAAGIALIVTLLLFARGSFVRSPRRLHRAIESGDLERLEKLLAAGADPNVPYDDVLPLQLAVMNDELKVARLLVRQGASVNRRSQDDLGYAPLHVAASLGSIAMAELLLRGGAAPNARDASEKTPLFVAATAGHEEMMSLLMERGADPNAEVGESGNLLTTALEASDVETAKRLLAVGADPNAGVGRTPLHLAAQMGDAALVGLLLERGADPNAVEPSGATALEVALRHQQEGVADVLRRGGARDHIRSARGGGLRVVQEPSPAATLVLKGPVKPTGDA